MHAQFDESLAPPHLEKTQLERLLKKSVLQIETEEFRFVVESALRKSYDGKLPLWFVLPNGKKVYRERIGKTSIKDKFLVEKENP